MKKRFDTETINQVRKPKPQITKVIIGYYAWLDKLSVISHDLDVVASNGENIAVENTYGRFDNIAKADIEKIRVWENSDYPSERMFMAAVYTYAPQGIIEKMKEEMAAFVASCAPNEGEDMAKIAAAILEAEPME